MRTIVGLAIFCLGISFYACKPADNGERPEAGIALDSLVRRVVIPSHAMEKVFNAVVILPETYYLDSTPRFYPVVYLLHGYSGNYANWYERMPELPALASEHQTIIVTPEGGYSSWYVNSYVDSTEHFFTYISQEVPSYIDGHFRTRPEATYRAITGLSMGGHGALSIALQRPEWFGLAGSMSGVVNLAPYPDKWEIDAQLGEYTLDSLRWQQHSVMGIAAKPNRNRPHLIIDCGTEDLLVEDNRKLHQLLSDSQIPHTYIERPGNHDWLYWQEALPYHLMFFSDRFGK
ncbi:MAG: alpha/beta hydrolase family protein [Saprospiraceae bacterium]